MDRDINEINFYSEGIRLTTVRSYAVPRRGEIVNIEKDDYRVIEVFWAVDYLGAAEDKTRITKLQRLRAIVDLTPLQTESKEGSK